MSEADERNLQDATKPGDGRATGMFGRPGRMFYPHGAEPAYTDAVHSSPHAGDAGLSDAPPTTGGVMRPHAHPGSIPEYSAHFDQTTNDTLADSRRWQQREARRVKSRHINQPHFNILHDRLRTRDGWEKCVDTYFNGPLNVPAAGASALTNVSRTNPLFPGNPGNMLMHAYVNYAGLGAQGTTLTGLWWAELLIGTNVIPLGLASGLAAIQAGIGLLASVPFTGDLDDKTPIAQVRVSILAGATVSAVVMQGIISVSYVYRYIPSPKHFMREVTATASEHFVNVKSN